MHKKAEKYSDEYFSLNTDSYSAVVLYVLKEQLKNPNWSQMDNIFNFPQNKKELTKEQLSAFTPVNSEARIKKLMKKLFCVKNCTDREVRTFSKWLASCTKQPRHMSQEEDEHAEVQEKNCICIIFINFYFSHQN